MCCKAPFEFMSDGMKHPAYSYSAEVEKTLRLGKPVMVSGSKGFKSKWSSNVNSVFSKTQ